MRLYVGNVPYQATDAELQDWFTQSGVKVDAVEVIRDRFSGEPRGFAFAELKDEEGERAIQACNGKDFQGRTLVVNEARPPREAGSRPGGGGGAAHRSSAGGGRQRREF